MRFETWSVLTIIIALVLAAIAVAALPVERSLPVFIAALVVVFVASISWVFGYVRTEHWLELRSGLDGSHGTR